MTAFKTMINMAKVFVVVGLLLALALHILEVVYLWHHTHTASSAASYLTVCDGQVIAQALWGTPIENNCPDEHSPFQEYIQGVAHP